MQVDYSGGAGRAKRARPAAQWRGFATRSGRGRLVSEQVADVHAQALVDLLQDIDGGVRLAVLDVGEVGEVNVDHHAELVQGNVALGAQDADVPAQAEAVRFFR